MLVICNPMDQRSCENTREQAHTKFCESRTLTAGTVFEGQHTFRDDKEECSSCQGTCSKGESDLLKDSLDRCDLCAKKEAKHPNQRDQAGDAVGKKGQL
mmetsp:Transcript_7181/g.13607  ORF Transcript_7181/g.13607 Transcript_7181/m.13607 type:complete len:99 (+) Transcript_7181:851-1147(+)